MISDAVRKAAVANLVGTYFTLGAATPNARVWEEPGFRACLGDAPHPISNFALGLDLNPWVARRLAAIATENPAFNVYLTPADTPDHADEILERAGFVTNYSLVQMARPGEAQPDLPIQPVEATGPVVRRETADFMVGQFFARQSGAFKRLISEATASSQNLTLYSLFEKDRRVAALMTYRESGTLGIYNLCVDPSRRGRGIGAHLVRFALDQAFAHGESAVLQCEFRLSPWYASLGFEEAGTVKVFRLLSGAGVAIMD